VFCAYSLWEPLGNFLLKYLPQEKAEQFSSFFFFFNTELAFAMYTYLIFIYMKVEGDLWNIALSKFIYLAAFGALADRVFFDPYKISVNDYLLYLITLIMLIRDVRRETKGTRRKNR